MTSNIRKPELAYKIFINEAKMMEDRNLIGHEHHFNSRMSYGEFIDNIWKSDLNIKDHDYFKRLNLDWKSRDNNIVYMFVHFKDEKNPSDKVISTVTSINLVRYRYIFVADEFKDNIIASLEKKHSDFQFFTYEEFLINPTKHIFGEEYIKMTEKEFNELFGPSFNIDPKNENILKYLKEILKYPDLDLSEKDIEDIKNNELSPERLNYILENENIIKLLEKQVVNTKTDYSSFFSDGVKKGKFPKFDINKPLSKWYDWSSGDVIKIIRKNKIYPSTVPVNISYRVVK